MRNGTAVNQQVTFLIIRCVGYALKFTSDDIICAIYMSFYPALKNKEHIYNCIVTECVRRSAMNVTNTFVWTWKRANDEKNIFGMDLVGLEVYVQRHSWPIFSQNKQHVRVSARLDSFVGF
jgi:hypothetical protein